MRDGRLSVVGRECLSGSARCLISTLKMMPRRLHAARQRYACATDISRAWAAERAGADADAGRGHAYTFSSEESSAM